MKPFILFFHSNIFLAVTAVSLSLASQIQLEIRLHWHPSLFIIFFATLCEYNLHRFIALQTNRNSLRTTSDSWVIQHPSWFYALFAISIAGLSLALMQASFNTVLALSPFLILTLFYSLPLTPTTKKLFRLRQIPYLKIIIISCVWSCVTVLLPAVESESNLDFRNILLIILERFFFVFAIALQFDTRDIETDRRLGLKTIPLYFGTKKSLWISLFALILFFLISTVHYISHNRYSIYTAFFISFLSTAFVVASPTLRRHKLYYYGILDGTIFVQAALVVLFSHR